MQHFLLSAKSRSLSLKKIYKMGEQAAYDLFRQIRWPETNGELSAAARSHMTSKRAVNSSVKAVSIISV